MRKPIVSACVVFVAPLLMAQQEPSAAGTPQATPVLDQTCAARCFSPIEAVTLASQVAPRGGLAGRFAIQVKAAGEQDGRFFLNSETDYRDRNCLTVSLTSGVATALAGRADIAAVRDRFVGKWIYVDGVARRVTIIITADGKPTEKYYYQVHVAVRDPRQIQNDARETIF